MQPQRGTGLGDLLRGTKSIFLRGVYYIVERPAAEGIPEVIRIIDDNGNTVPIYIFSDDEDVEIVVISEDDDEEYKNIPPRSSDDESDGEDDDLSSSSTSEDSDDTLSFVEEDDDDREHGVEGDDEDESDDDIIRPLGFEDRPLPSSESWNCLLDTDSSEEPTSSACGFNSSRKRSREDSDEEGRPAQGPSRTC
ncbi:uncharacterized protein LOC127357742 isoform X2 [Dicentrarchus labrax]|uniref:uncharacterized protein LOC127357742 isoform X2 n=1 Tax=Dicentrarchus labrax TaxID=13489 RepID=UPI0021F543E0|nr:uncharacterized protein LOC127357742 isoform X2 [Dicentrarchus labrax]